MAALFNLARMTVSSSGPGDITLNSAVSGYLTFDLAGCSTAAAGQSLAYAINDITASEIGTATYYSSALALRARTPNRSTNGNAVIAMSNAAQVFITPRAEDFYPITSGSTQFSNASVIFASSLGQFTQDAGLFYSSSIARLQVSGTVVVSSAITGNSVGVSSDASVGHNLGVTGAATIGGALAATSVTASSTPTTGAVIVSGGVGVAGAVNVGNTGGGVSTFTRNAAPVGAAVATIQVGYEGGVIAEGITFRPQGDGSFPAVFYNAAGSIVGNINTNATDTFYNTISDGRLKTDPQPFDGAALIAALKPYDFAWKSNGARGHGVFAEEAMAVYPGAVTYDQKNDAYGVDYSKFVPLLIRALQQANDRIAALEAKGKP